MGLASLWNWRSIRFRLACLVTACVLPVWLAAGSLVYFAYQDKKRTIETELLQTARNLRLVLDQEIEVIQSVLHALSTSPALGTGDFGAFHHQAKRLLQSYEGADIILADATGQQLVNSYRPLGASLPKRNIGTVVARVFEQGKAGVSGLFKGAVTGRNMISVDVPVFRDGKVAYDLAMTLPTDRIVAIMSRYPLPPGWVGLVMDSDRVVVNRTLAPEQYVGKRIPPLLGGPGPGDFVREFRNLEDIPSLASMSKSAATGWAVVLHVPKPLVWVKLRSWLLWAVAGTSLLSVAGVGLAGLIGRSISRSIWGLIPPARDLAAGKRAYPGNLGLEETDAVGRALEEASGLLMERTANLERSNRELEDFAAMASHDLQEPLRKIKAFGERLRENNAQNLDETGLDYLRRMEGAGDRMESLILDLLEYSRITTRPNPFVPTDLEALAREAVVDIEAAVAETGGRIVIGPMPTASVDVPQLRRAFQNLFSNALKFHGQDAPEITVSGTVVTEDGRPYARIEVADNGIGFEEKYRDKIFQPFQRLHGRSKFPGTGIGLAIVRKSVERHGGTVTAESQPGQGATFIMRIPLNQQTPEN
ncbi:integral membrane sensor signal transduction histidine kinase [Solidesulfovibrio carbinoliphilus subsp. oakridgensis]|uniref:histidine kinase n=1 Tax=Solidesulfovibrio carbinoliphilus subsp. oakridgensis TaxID=694327 RepID=G7Q6F8_9BACT|nr:ATP-binding protein [Solidesulfovibrio carbinoliphilus]EHJ47571.1 integral membrane sensor signal transduction histidine kinase [Solidesulfovibrio carbinoliphilus subsp. oakridgensis]